MRRVAGRHFGKRFQLTRATPDRCEARLRDLTAQVAMAMQFGASSTFARLGMNPHAVPRRVPAASGTGYVLLSSQGHRRSHGRLACPVRATLDLPVDERPAALL